MDLIYGKWIAVENNNCFLIFNRDGIVIKVCNDDIYINEFEVDIYNRIVVYIVPVCVLYRRGYVPNKREIFIGMNVWLCFDNSWDGNSVRDVANRCYLDLGYRYIRSGNNIDDLQRVQNKKEGEPYIINYILGNQSRHSGGNRNVSMFMVLLGVLLILYLIIEMFFIESSIMLFSFGLCMAALLIIWGRTRLYHNRLFSKIKIQENAFPELSKKQIFDYLRPSLKNEEVNINEYLSDYSKQNRIVR